MSYRTIIGLEVHVQLLTETKLFCGCSMKFGLPANSATCPVCIGMPGTLPVMNRRAFDLALKAALALNCRIASFTKWDRKNYYYPDLPKNYQISQYDLPFSSDGWLEIPLADGAHKRIGIIRAHLEEDAGKMMHDEQRPSPLTPLPGGEGKGLPLTPLPQGEGKGLPVTPLPQGEGKGLPVTPLPQGEGKGLPVTPLPGGEGKGVRGDSLVDLNRAGTPLLEIVSRPELTGPEEARAYLEEIRLLLRELEVSDCEMQEGSLRCDANVNIHVAIDGTPDSLAATPIVEIKNLNSIRGVERALKYEADRQFHELQQRLGSDWQLGEPTPFAGIMVRPVCEQRQGQLAPVFKATAGWDDKRGVTEVQRRKEEAADYRYFPEPDLVPIIVDEPAVERVRAGLGELPAAQNARLQKQYGLSAYDGGVLSRQGRAFVAYFETVAAVSGDAKDACNWSVNDLLQTLNERKLDVKSCPIAPEHLGELISEVRSSGLNKARAREVYAEMLQSGLSAKTAIAKLGFTAVTDENQLLEIVRRAIAANAKAVADFKKGKTKAADAIKGAIMRETKGLAKTEVVQRLLFEELEKLTIDN